MRSQQLRATLESAEDAPRFHLFSAIRARKTCALLLAVITLSTFQVLPLAAGTKILHRWVLTGQPMPELKKILVIAVVENYLIRQHFEDEMEKLLAKSGVEGVKSHMVLPPRNELMEGELKQRIKESDYDAVLVIRPKAARQETKEVVTSGFYMPPPGYYALWPYWNMAYMQFSQTSSYLEDNTIVTAEFNLYNTKNEKLLWSGETDTVYSKEFGKLGKEYAGALVTQLKKDKVIGKK
jgi:hypothetical protein